VFHPKLKSRRKIVRMSFPKKSDVMSLDVIQRAGATRTARQKAESGFQDSSLRTSDIERSCPTYHWKQYLDRPSLSSLDDIAGSKATPLNTSLNRPIDMSMTTSDIDWARPKVNRFRTGRNTNPMDPQYELPTATPCEPYIPYYSGRPTLDVSDIDQAFPRKIIPVRAHGPKGDVEFAAPNYLRRLVRPIPPQGMGNSLDVADINHGDSKVPRPRLTNPMEPVYRVPQTTCTSIYHAWKGDEELPPLEPATIGEIPLSKARTLDLATKKPSNSLVNDDIEGAKSQRYIGTLPFHMYLSNKPAHNLGSTDDIDGAKSGSLRRGLVSKRCTNPLDPTYQLPGH
jgi:hypothetical protein